MSLFIKAFGLIAALAVLILFSLRLVKKWKVIREAYTQGYNDAIAGRYNATLQNHHKINQFTNPKE